MSLADEIDEFFTTEPTKERLHSFFFEASRRFIELRGFERFAFIFEDHPHIVHDSIELSDKELPVFLAQMSDILHNEVPDG